MGQSWGNWVFVFLLVASVPMLLTLISLAWTLRGAKAALRSIKPSYALR